MQTWRIRLAGIDAPEKRQPFGQASRQHLASLVFQRTVQVDWKKRDRYARIVGTIHIDGADANLMQITAGMAWVYRRYMEELEAPERARYLKGEDMARAEKRGVWTDPAPTPPWEWRRRKTN